VAEWFEEKLGVSVLIFVRWDQTIRSKRDSTAFFLDLPKRLNKSGSKGRLAIYDVI
jgi:hypothetical protein